MRNPAIQDKDTLFQPAVSFDFMVAASKPFFVINIYQDILQANPTSIILFEDNRYNKMTLPDGNFPQLETIDALKTRFWIYTNYDCNLSCSYCVAESSPSAHRRSLSLALVQKLCDEAADLGFEQVFFTGGEPFILPEIYAMLAYACQRFDTTVLTNAMLLNGKRLEQLRAVRNERLVIQVSLDGGAPEQHDPFRGQGSWIKTAAGLRSLLAEGFRVRIATTQTEANAGQLSALCEFHLALGIPESEHIIRPLARRGFSQRGLEVGKHNLKPEITVNSGGVYWHPLSTDADLLVSNQIFPFADAVCQVQAELQAILKTPDTGLNTFQ